MKELEAKVRIFEAIANNNRNSLQPTNVARNTNDVYKILTRKEL